MLSSQQPQAALKQEARRDSLKLGSRRLPLKLETRSRSDHTKVAQRPPETRSQSDRMKVAKRPPKFESAAKLQLSFYYKCAIPSFLVILRIDGVVQGVGNEESGDSAKS